MVFGRCALVCGAVLAFLSTQAQLNCIRLGDKGTEDVITKDRYPYTVFYKADDNGSFGYNQNAITSLNNYQQSLRQLVNDGKDDPPRDTTAKVPFETYKALFDNAFGNTESYVAYETDGHKTKFAYQIKARAFVLVCATNKAGSALSADSLQDLRDD